MKSRAKTPRASRHAWRGYVLAAGTLLTVTGCTPEEQQALLEQISSVVGDLLSGLLAAQAQQFVTFVTSFARNALAAFLF